MIATAAPATPSSRRSTAASLRSTASRAARRSPGSRRTSPTRSSPPPTAPCARGRRTRCARSARSRSRRRELLVTGNTARFIDQKQSLEDHAPLVIGFVCLTTLLILFLLTGSVLLPIKTLLMNALTLAATLGILVLGFQEGWLDGLFNYTGPTRSR